MKPLMTKKISTPDVPISRGIKDRFDRVERLKRGLELPLAPLAHANTDIETISVFRLLTIEAG